MRFSHPFVVLAALTAAAAAQGPALTIYNQNFAVVRDRVALDLQQGSNEVRFVGVTAALEPDSVVLRDPAGKVVLSILEQNYRADTVSQDLLLRHFEGKEIEFLNVDMQGGEHRVRGRIVRAPQLPGESALVEAEGSLRFGMPGQPLFPSLGDDAILYPTLSWRLHAPEAAKLSGEVSYVTGGLSWQAAYNLIAPEKGDTVDLVGWITIDNESGKTFADATIKLMAGDVNKIQPQEMAVTGSDNFYLGASRAAAPKVTEKAFDEFHLYSLPLPTTLRDKQKKQVEFVHALGVKAPTLYVYDGAALGAGRWWPFEAIRSQPDYGTQSNPKVWVMREFVNSEANGLGLPLPQGRLRFYRRDDADGRLEFTGENTIDHTPKDERLRVYTGNSFDLVGERKRTDFRSEGNGLVAEEEFEIHVRNHKAEPVEVRVVEHLYRWSNWTILKESQEHAKTDAQTMEYRVKVPANGEQVVTYRVRYTW